MSNQLGCWDFKSLSFKHPTWVERGPTIQTKPRQERRRPETSKTPLIHLQLSNIKIFESSFWWRMMGQWCPSCYPFAPLLHSKNHSKPYNGPPWTKNPLSVSFTCKTPQKWSTEIHWNQLKQKCGPCNQTALWVLNHSPGVNTPLKSFSVFCHSQNSRASSAESIFKAARISLFASQAWPSGSPFASICFCRGHNKCTQIRIWSQYEHEFVPVLTDKCRICQ